MSHYRVCKVKNDQLAANEGKKFDNKEDAEHYAKNQSILDNAHQYEVQENNKGEFVLIKAYQSGVAV